ncbi:MAG TPA: winged helix-turn-helix domain-containing protein, partial [Candidatus Nanoarchaeia archaeon]|nr:winged helix-turn-helix domain-containing protein [Candidatus Nanoarchaeia archaeon]
EELGLAHTSVLSHMKVLEKAKLVQKEETSRKWKYYRITESGKKIIKPENIEVLVMLAVSGLGFLSFGALYLSKLFGTKGGDFITEEALDSTALMMKTAEVVQSPVVTSNMKIYGLVFAIFAIATLILTAIYFRRRNSLRKSMTKK